MHGSSKAIITIPLVLVNGIQGTRSTMINGWRLQASLDGRYTDTRFDDQSSAIKAREALLRTRREKIGKNKWRTHIPMGWTAISRVR